MVTELFRNQTFVRNIYLQPNRYTNTLSVKPNTLENRS